VLCEDTAVVGDRCAKRAKQAARDAAKIEGKKLSLSRTVAFPVLSSSKKAFKAEQAWKNDMKARGYKTVEPALATFLISKQPRHDKLPGGKLCSGTQFFNHIEGQSAFVDKFLLIRLLAEYQANVDKSFDINAFSPRTYLLSDADHCDAAMKVLGAAQETKGVVQWIRKKRGAENGKGIKLLDAGDVSSMYKDYQKKVELSKLKKQEKKAGGERASNCNEVILQRYIHNPLLIKGHKCDFRVYAFVASTSPALLSFFHPRFYMKCSPEKYSPMSTDKAAGLSNQQQM
jgi:hypothetical protein